MATLNMSGSDPNADPDPEPEPDYDLDPETDFDLERADDGAVVCPMDGCRRAPESTHALNLHHNRVHGGSIVSHIVAEDKWRAYLRHHHVTCQRPASEIAAHLPKHITKRQVLIDLKAFDLFDTAVGERRSKKGLTRLLEQADSIEEARQLANGGEI